MTARCNVSMNSRECEVVTGKVCFGCGSAACGACSDIVHYLKYGKKRLCNDCQEEREGWFTAVSSATNRSKAPSSS